jgi:hypothetical protein
VNRESYCQILVLDFIVARTPIPSSVPLLIQQVPLLGHVVEHVLALVGEPELRAREEWNMQVSPQLDDVADQLIHRGLLAPRRMHGVHE